MNNEHDLPDNPQRRKTLGCLAAWSGAAAVWALAGSRIDYVGGTRVPVLVYRHGQHWIDVFVFPSDAATPQETHVQGYRLVPIRLGDQPAAIVTDMDATELARFAGLVTAGS